MRLGLLALAVVICFGCCAALAAEESQSVVSGPVTVTGTLVSVDKLDLVDKPEWAALRLRADEPAGDQVKTGEVLALQCMWTKLRGMGLGDQVRATVAMTPAEPASWTVEEITRLGRGEFLNPAAKASIDLGSPDAKVLVKMFAPLGIACHQTTVDLLKQLAEEEPQRLRVQIFDMHAPAMVEEVNRERLSCATVLVNNRYQFTIREGDKERKVEMTHRPNAEQSTYNSEDVPVVVRQEIARIYGPAKTGEAAAPAG